MNLRLAVLLLAAVWFAGCATPPANPSFPLTPTAAREALKAMKEHPRPLPRPLVILAGYLDPGLASSHLRREFRKLTHDDPRILSVTFFWSDDFDACRRKLVERVDAAFPVDDPVWTAEVDVLAVSMGGLVAVDAWREPADPAMRRLRIASLFTLSTPFRGARMAGLPSLDQRHRAMRAGSPFVASLAAALGHRDFEFYPYVRLDDGIVGPVNAAPAGDTAWWVPNLPFEGAHLKVAHDPRIKADIARRLRGQTPFATEPRAALP
jgi:hypothetical protein